MKRIMTLIMGVVGMVFFFVLAGAASAGDMANIAAEWPPDHLGGITGMAMLINASTINGLFQSLKATFNKAFSEAASDWEKTAMKVPSSTSQENYAWLSQFPRMRKWIGDKVIKALEAFSYSVKNEDFEATIAVDRNHIADDQLGIYGPMTQTAGQSAKQLPDEIVADLKNNAFGSVCYDGQYFYDTDHEVAGASVSNKGTMALSSLTIAACKASYGVARLALMNMKDDEGRPLALSGTILEVPPALETVGKLICYGDKLEDDKPNPYKGTAELVVNRRLTSSTAWFLHDCSQPIKPFVYQEREKPSFVSQTNPDSDDVFMRKTYKFGCEARANGGYTFWQMSYGSTGDA